MGRHKREARLARLLKTAEVESEFDIEAESKPPDEKPITALTAFCPWCNRDVWKVPNTPEFTSAEIEPIGHKVTNNQSLLTNCPFCNSGVFDRRYYGGWEFSTRELGRVPSGSRLLPGVRIPRTHSLHRTR